MRIFPKLTPRIKLVKSLFGDFAGMTIYPFVVLCEGYEKDKRLVAHELVHIEQQDKYWKWLGPLGLLTWWFLYGCVLPVGWNRFRANAEIEAYQKGQGYGMGLIGKILRESYKLYWMKF